MLDDDRASPNHKCDFSHFQPHMRQPALDSAGSYAEACRMAVLTQRFRDYLLGLNRSGESWADISSSSGLPLNTLREFALKTDRQIKLSQVEDFCRGRGISVAEALGLEGDHDSALFDAVLEAALLGEGLPPERAQDLVVICQRSYQAARSHGVTADQRAALQALAGAFAQPVA